MHLLVNTPFYARCTLTEVYQTEVGFCDHFIQAMPVFPNEGKCPQILLVLQLSV